MAEEPTANERRDIVPRRLDLVPRLCRQIEKRTVHQHAPQMRDPEWINYTNQRYVRDLAIDSERGWIWMATWGGILCWQPEKERCWRYTSEHGLSGNAIRYLAIDRSGIVWAGGQEIGLYYFDPDRDSLWCSHQDLENWTVSCLTPRPEGGIYAALENANMQWALSELASPKNELLLLVQKGLAIKDIATLLVDEQGTLWLGNLWGLHCWHGKGEPESFELGNKQVRALAEAVGGGLWLGTNWGLYRLPVGAKLLQAPDWTQEEIFSLAIDPETGDLWAVTTTGVGRIADGSWQTVSKSPPGQLTKAIALPSTLKPRFGEGQVFVGGANGLYLTNIDSSQPALTGSDEDTLSNAVHCLRADEKAVWVGTARGLHCWDGKAWRSYGAEAPNLRDVRNLLPDGETGRLWVGTFRIGLQRIEQGVYIPPDSVLKAPIISLTANPDGTLWATTFDVIYCRPSGQKDWQAVLHPAEEHIGQGLIQMICHQITEGTATLWVGTSSGLFRYRPELGLWDAAQDFASGELEHLSIQALAIDPFFQQLWIGTSQGLFGELNGQFSKLDGFGLLDVRALAFAADRTLWVGTPLGLFSFSMDEDRETFREKILFEARIEQKEHFTPANSGLASDIVTALSVRTVDHAQEIWIGTPRGVSCHRYQPKRIEPVDVGTIYELDQSVVIGDIKIQKRKY